MTATQQTLAYEDIEQLEENIFERDSRQTCEIPFLCDLPDPFSSLFQCDLP